MAIVYYPQGPLAPRPGPRTPRESLDPLNCSKTLRGPRLTLASGALGRALRHRPAAAAPPPPPSQVRVLYYLDDLTLDVSPVRARPGCLVL